MSMRKQSRSQRSPSPHSIPLRLTALEDRWVPHSGLTEFTTGISAGAAPAGIVFGPDDNLWFAENGTSKIARMTRLGVVTEFNLPAGRGPLNIVVGPDSKLWFTNNSGDTIGRIDPRAGSDAAIQSSLAEFAVPGAGSAPHDLVSGPDGALWFTQSGSDQIGRITVTGTVTEFAVTGAGSAPAGITSGSDGALWFTQAGSGQIGRITTSGTVSEFTIPVPANGVSDPEDIIAGPAGALYFTDFGRDQIGRITTSGEITQFNLQAGRGPSQLVVDDEGDLYFTEAASGRIGRLPANALAPNRPTSGSPPLEEFDFIAADSVPLGITIDELGDIFLTMNNRNSVGFFEAHLQQITIASTGSTVQVFDRNLDQVRTLTPFAGFTGEIVLAVQEMSGNGVPDAIVGAGPGGSPRVQVFDGADNTLVANFFAFDPSIRSGIQLGSDDVNGDGRPDIIVTSLNNVKVIDGTKLSQVGANGVIQDSALLASFVAFESGLASAVSVAAGDLNDDGMADVIVGAGAGGGPRVRIIDGSKIQTKGTTAEAAQIGNFFAYDPSFRGGVFVSVAFNGNSRDVIVGSGPGGGPHIRVIDPSKVSQVSADGQIASTALRGNFFAYDPTLRSGVRVAADDLNNDGFAELILAPGPGTAPEVRVVDGSKFTSVGADGLINSNALFKSFATSNPDFRGGVYIAADADHRDGPIFGPPGVTVTNSRRDVNDVYVFQSPVTPTNTVLVMSVSPFATATTPTLFEPGVLFDFRIANRELVNTTDDLTFRAVFSNPDSKGVQDVSLRALPAARFAGSGGVLVKGLTGENITVRGVGDSKTSQFRAAEQDDAFFFDAAGFNGLLNSKTAVDGVVAGKFPRGTTTGGFGVNSTPNYDAPNFFAGANILALTLELPSSKIVGPAGGALGTAIGVWGRSEADGKQVDRMGRPAINTALIPPVPRGADFPVGGTTDQNRQDRRTAFNTGHPRDDRANFGADMVSVLTTFYPAGRPGGVPNEGQAKVVANLLLPDILVFNTANSAGFAGDLVTVGGETFLAGGRKLSDDIISTELSVLTDDDLPAALGGGPNAPALITQNVRDDNGLNLKDGSIDPPAPRGNGAAGTGTQREAVFPYIGSRNANPSPVPGSPPPP